MREKFDKERGQAAAKRPYFRPTLVARGRLQAVAGDAQVTGNTEDGSDIRLKRDLVQLALLAGGIRLYRYRYLWSDQLYVGVMAQEVQKIVPEAVVQGADGFLRVNYARLGLKLQTWEEWTRSSPSSTAVAA